VLIGLLKLDFAGVFCPFVAKILHSATIIPASCFNPLKHKIGYYLVAEQRDVAL
jgi:hypothetical protein